MTVFREIRRMPRWAGEKYSRVKAGDVTFRKINVSGPNRFSGTGQRNVSACEIYELWVCLYIFQRLTFFFAGTETGRGESRVKVSGPLPKITIRKIFNTNVCIFFFLRRVLTEILNSTRFWGRRKRRFCERLVCVRYAILSRKQTTTVFKKNIKQGKHSPSYVTPHHSVYIL